MMFPTLPESKAEISRFDSRCLLDCHGKADAVVLRSTCPAVLSSSCNHATVVHTCQFWTSNYVYIPRQMGRFSILQLECFSLQASGTEHFQSLLLHALSAVDDNMLRLGLKMK